MEAARDDKSDGFDVEALVNDIKALESRVSQIEAKQRECVEKLEESNAKTNAIQSALSESNSSLHDLDRRSQAQNEAIDELRNVMSKVSTIEEDLSSLRLNVTKEYQSHMNEMLRQHTPENLQNAILKNSRDLSALQRLVDQTDNEIDLMNTTLEAKIQNHDVILISLQEEKEQWNVILGNITNAMQEIGPNSNNLESNCCDTTMKEILRQHNPENLQRAISKNSQDLSALQRTMVETENEINVMNTTLKDKIQNHDVMLINLQQETERWNVILSNVTHSMLEFRRDIDQLESSSCDQKTFRTEFERHDRKMANFRADISNHTHWLNVLHKETNHLKSQPVINIGTFVSEMESHERTMRKMTANISDHTVWLNALTSQILENDLMWNSSISNVTTSLLELEQRDEEKLEKINADILNHTETLNELTEETKDLSSAQRAQDYSIKSLNNFKRSHKDYGKKQ